MRLAGQSDHFSARILDAGVNGMRLEIPDSEELQVGCDLDLSCRSCRLDSSADSAAVALRCRVIWEDEQKHQVGLAYMS